MAIAQRRLGSRSNWWTGILVSISMVNGACATGSSARVAPDERFGALCPAAEWRSGFVKSTGGVQIRYDVAGRGDGVPLVVVSGGPGSDHRYMRIGGAFDCLAVGRTVVMFDQRGTGKSGPAGDTPALADWAHDVDSIRRALGAARIDLLGHSFGGLVAMAYADGFPSSLRSLILVDSSAPQLSANKQLLADVYPDRIAAWRAKRAQLAPRFSAPEIAIFFSMEFVNPRVAERYLAAVSGFTYNIEVNNRLRNELRQLDYSNTLRTLAVPALVVHGRQDAVIAPATAASLAALIPSAQLVFIDGAGHLPFVEQPDAFARVVKTFAAALP